jgi:hypothetical protein
MLASPLSAQRYAVFADESGTHVGDSCFGIGALIVPEGRLDRFNQFFDVRKAQYSSGSEPCWEEIRKSYGDMNLALDLLTAVLTVKEARFSTIIVKKDIYRRWEENKELGFWIAYHHLLTSLAGLKSGQYHVTLDPRSDKYAKHNEVIELTGNYALQKLPRGGVLNSVVWGDSRTTAGIQAADLLTGAIVASHNASMRPSRSIQAGKRLLIGKLAAVLGWPDLFCDTWPNPKFNIWHFPDRDGSEGWRAYPETRSVGRPRQVPLVTLQDVRNL